MKLIDLLALSLEHLSTHGLSVILVCLLAATLSLATLLYLYTQYQHLSSKPMSTACPAKAMSALEEYQRTCNDFDQEVDAWESAAHVKKGEL